MKFGEAIKTCFSKYAVFSGRARRSEFWFWALFTGIVTYALSLLGGLIFGEDSSVVKIGRYVVVLPFLLPSLAVSWRRMHDIGKPGALCLLVYAATFIELFGTTLALLGAQQGESSLALIGFGLMLAAVVICIIFLVWMCKNSQSGDNKYGPDPKSDEYF